MLLIGRESGKGQIGKIPGPSPSKSGKSRKNRESPKTLSFLSLFFWKNARKTTKKTRIFYPHRTPKIPGKEGENAQKNKEFLAREKNKEIPKTRKGRTGKGQKKTKKEGQVQIGKPPRLKPPCLAGPSNILIVS